MAADANHLAERGIEPRRDGGATVGDGSRRPGVAPESDPALPDRQLGAGEGRGLGVSEEVGDERTDGVPGVPRGRLDSRGEEL